MWLIWLLVGCLVWVCGFWWCWGVVLMWWSLLVFCVGFWYWCFFCWWWYLDVWYRLWCGIFCVDVWWWCGWCLFVWFWYEWSYGFLGFLVIGCCNFCYLYISGCFRCGWFEDVFWWGLFFDLLCVFFCFDGFDLMNFDGDFWKWFYDFVVMVMGVWVIVFYDQVFVDLCFGDD